MNGSANHFTTNPSSMLNRSSRTFKTQKKNINCTYRWSNHHVCYESVNSSISNLTGIVVFKTKPIIVVVWLSFFLNNSNNNKIDF